MKEKIPVGYLIYQAQRAIHQTINQSFIKAGLPIIVEQWPVLMELFHSNGSSHQYIAEKTRKDKTTVTRLIATMERNGLVECKQDEIDRRKKLIFYTEKAKSLKHEIETVLSEVNKTLLTDVCCNDEEVLRRVLSRIFCNLNWNFEFMA